MYRFCIAFAVLLYHYITNDISISWKKGNGFVNEVNDQPAIDGHLTVNKNNKKKIYDRLAKILKNNN